MFKVEWGRPTLSLHRSGPVAVFFALIASSVVLAFGVARFGAPGDGLAMLTSKENQVTIETSDMNRMSADARTTAAGVASYLRDAGSEANGWAADVDRAVQAALNGNDTPMFSLHTRLAERFGAVDDTPRASSDRPFSTLDGAALDRYVRSGGREVDGLSFLTEDGARYVDVSEVVHQSLQVSSDPGGGYAVIADLQREVLIDEMYQGAFESAGAAARIIEGDIYSEVIASGDIVAPAPEIAIAGESTNPNVQLWQTDLTKFRTMQFVTEQQLQDRHADLTAGVINLIRDQLLQSEDVYLANGDGIGLNPLGFLRDTAITTFDVEGTTPTTISNTTSDLGSAIKIVNMMGQLAARFHAGARWMMNGATAAAIRGLVDADGRPYFPEFYTGDVLIGKPVILNDGFPVGGTADQPVIALGNFGRGFRLVRKAQGVGIRILDQRYADQDLVGIRGVYRVGGGVILPAAFVIGVADAVA